MVTTRSAAKRKFCTSMLVRLDELSLLRVASKSDAAGLAALSVVCRETRNFVRANKHIIRFLAALDRGRERDAWDELAERGGTDALLSVLQLRRSDASGSEACRRAEGFAMASAARFGMVDAVSRIMDRLPHHAEAVKDGLWSACDWGSFAVVDAILDHPRNEAHVNWDCGAGASLLAVAARGSQDEATMLGLLRRGATLWHSSDVWPESEEYVQTFRGTRIRDQITEIKTLVTPGPFSDDDDEGDDDDDDDAYTLENE